MVVFWGDRGDSKGGLGQMELSLGRVVNFILRGLNSFVLNWGQKCFLPLKVIGVNT